MNEARNVVRDHRGRVPAVPDERLGRTCDRCILQAIHRLRTRLITRRTAVINQMRGFLLKRGRLHERARSRRLAGVSATSTLDWRQDHASRHQQARQCDLRCLFIHVRATKFHHIRIVSGNLRKPWSAKEDHMGRGPLVRGSGAGDLLASLPPSLRGQSDGSLQSRMLRHRAIRGSSVTVCPGACLTR
jgi:hypothetical protein